MVEGEEADPVREELLEDFDPFPCDRVFETWVGERDWLVSPFEGSAVTVL